MLGTKFRDSRLGAVQMARADRNNLGARQARRRVDVGPGVPSCPNDTDPRLVHRQHSPWPPQKSARADFRTPNQGRTIRGRNCGIEGLSLYPRIPLSPCPVCLLRDFVAPASNGLKIRTYWWAAAHSSTILPCQESGTS